MDGFMIRLLNMSFTAGCICIIVMILRVLLRRLPKIYSYALWGIVIFRFLCPFTLESVVSLLPFRPEPVSQAIVYDKTPQINSGVVWFDQTVNQVLGQTMAVDDMMTSVNPIQVWLFLLEVVWAAGMLGFGLYYLISYISLRRKLEDSVRLKRNIFASDRISSPFTMGIVNPRIYLPFGLSKAEEKCILTHEWIHIRRRDGLVKMLGILVLMLHWFNPLAWVCVSVMCKDMEMACDEKAIKYLGLEERQQYSMTLFNVSLKHSGLVLPTAFGESSTKSRIRHVLNYKKPALWVSVCACAVLILAALTLMTNPKGAGEALAAGGEENPLKTEINKLKEKDASSVSIIGGADGPTSVFVAGKTDGDPIALDAGRLSRQILDIKAKKSPAVIDQAEDGMWMVHGDFGFYAFDGQEDVWNVILGGEDFKNVKEILNTLREQDPAADTGYLERAGLTGGYAEGMKPVTYNTRELEDGTVAVTGSFSDTNRLIDMFCGIYDPASRVLTQVYPFLGDAREVVNDPGRVTYRRYLFSADGYEYFLRTPQTLLQFEEGEARKCRLELVRSAAGEMEVLDPLVCLAKGGSAVSFENGKIVYPAAAQDSLEGWEHPVMVEINYDGSGRTQRAAQ